LTVEQAYVVCDFVGRRNIEVDDGVRHCAVEYDTLTTRAHSLVFMENISTLSVISVNKSFAVVTWELGIDCA